MRKIAIYTGSRADYSPLKYVIEQLGPAGRVISTKGMYGLELQIRNELEDIKPDIFCCLGDRYETLVAAGVAAEMCIPIAHISGGEETEGATDNAFRHAITKLAYWHFVAHEDFAQKVIQMGESPDRVVITGDPQVDGIAYEPVVELDWKGPSALVCYHAETLGSNGQNTEAIFTEIKKYQSVCVAGSNEDREGWKINQCWKNASEDLNNLHYQFSYLHHEWINLMRQADAVIGNSSSFCIEAMTLGKKVIMIGDRQKGRWEQAQRHFAENAYAYGKPGEVSMAIVDNLLHLELPDQPRKEFYAV